MDGTAQTIALKQKMNKTLNDRLGIKILKLQKPASGQLKLDHVIEPMALPRGRQTLTPVKQPGNNIMPGVMPNSIPGSIPGSMPGAIPGTITIPGSIQVPQSGSTSNMKR
jgi:hypothetical protein